MTIDAWLTLGVMAAMFAGMVRGVVTPAIAVLSAVVALLCLGIVEPPEAFAGFSNPAPITVAALFVLARAVDSSGALDPVERLALGGAAVGSRALLRLLAPAAAASAFLNNTPIVAMLAPAVVRWGERHGSPPSRLLMPLSFAVILGGVTTTIGTSTNLVVSGLLEAHGHPPLGLFEITRLGLPVAIAGIAILCVLAPRVVPDRTPPGARLADSDRDFVVRMRVAPGGEVDGRSVEQAGLRNLRGVFLVEIERSGETIAPVSPQTMLHADDDLIFVGEAREVFDLRRIAGLDSAESPHLASLEAPGRDVIEVVIGAASPLLGHTPRELGFRSRYQAAIVGIHRAGQPVSAKLGTVKLRLGDTLLLLADEGFRERFADRPDFLVAAAPDAQVRPIGWKAVLAGGVTVAVVGVAGSGLAPILHASLLGALVMVATGVLSMESARRSIDMDVILVIAASFGLGAAIEQSGLAATLGGSISHGLGDGVHWRLALLAVIVATVVLTEFISNNAAAALMFPIAIATATGLEVDPRRFAMAVAIAASASFLTPIGYQTNTMVYGLGGYRFSDYWRLGAPLTAVTIGVLVLLT